MKKLVASVLSLSLAFAGTGNLLAASGTSTISSVTAWASTEALNARSLAFATPRLTFYERLVSVGLAVALLLPAQKPPLPGSPGDRHRSEESSLRADEADSLTGEMRTAYVDYRNAKNEHQKARVGKQPLGLSQRTLAQLIAAEGTLFRLMQTTLDQLPRDTYRFLPWKDFDRHNKKSKGSRVLRSWVVGALLLIQSYHSMSAQTASPAPAAKKSTAEFHKIFEETISKVEAANRELAELLSENKESFDGYLDALIARHDTGKSSADHGLTASAFSKPKMLRGAFAHRALTVPDLEYDPNFVAKLLRMHELKKNIPRWIEGAAEARKYDDIIKVGEKPLSTQEYQRRLQRQRAAVSAWNVLETQLAQKQFPELLQVGVPTVVVAADAGFQMNFDIHTPFGTMHIGGQKRHPLEGAESAVVLTYLGRNSETQNPIFHQIELNETTLKSIPVRTSVKYKWVEIDLQTGDHRLVRSFDSDAWNDPIHVAYRQALARSAVWRVLPDRNGGSPTADDFIAAARAFRESVSRVAVAKDKFWASVNTQVNQNDTTGKTLRSDIRAYLYWLRALAAGDAGIEDLWTRYQQESQTIEQHAHSLLTHLVTSPDTKRVQALEKDYIALQNAIADIRRMTLPDLSKPLTETWVAFDTSEKVRLHIGIKNLGKNEYVVDVFNPHLPPRMKLGTSRTERTTEWIRVDPKTGRHSVLNRRTQTYETNSIPSILEDTGGLGTPPSPLAPLLSPFVPTPLRTAA